MGELPEQAAESLLAYRPDLASRSHLHVAQHDICRFPSSRLHDGLRVEAGNEHVLGGADAHGVTGQLRG